MQSYLLKEGASEIKNFFFKECILAMFIALGLPVRSFCLSGSREWKAMWQQSCKVINVPETMEAHENGYVGVRASPKTR